MACFIVFCAGMLVMIVELVASRMLAPYLGTQLIVWASIIGSVLFFFAAGSYFGGIIADRFGSAPDTKNNVIGPLANHDEERRVKLLDAFAVVLMICALFVLATGLLYRPLALLATELFKSSLYYSALAASITILAAPLTAFGMLNPLAMRMRIETVAYAGHVVGFYSSMATFGSLVGTFLGGFILLSYFTCAQIFFMCAGLLFLLACLCFISARQFKTAIMLAILSGLLFLIPFTVKDFDIYAPADSLTIETPYQTLRIKQGTDFTAEDSATARPVTYLKTSPFGYQGAMYKDDPNELMLPYTRFARDLPRLAPDAQDVLILGGGIYSIPRYFCDARSGLELEKLNIDVVEIDPLLWKVTGEHFALPAVDSVASFTRYDQDARRFLNTNTKKYDIIVLDVMDPQCGVPFHLATIEAISHLHDALNDDGILYVNVFSAQAGDKGRFYRAVLHGLRHFFPQVVAVTPFDAQELEKRQNILLFASKTHSERLERQTQTWHVAGSLLTMPITLDVPPLLDAYAPVERYTLDLL